MNKISFNTPQINNNIYNSNKNQPITSKQIITETKNKSNVSRAVILSSAMVLLAVPIVLSKMPVGKSIVLKNMQNSLNTFLHTTKLNLDKLMSHTTGGNSGIRDIAR